MIRLAPSRRARRARPDSEDGTIAILYSVLMLVMIGLLAMTIDLGALRYDRRESQVTSDMAATAGGMNLASGLGVNGSPRKACQAAWEYFLLNTPQADQSEPSPCDEFPEPPPVCDPLNPLAAIHAVATPDPYVVAITWPVHDDDAALMDGRFDPTVDGSACDRLGVQILRSRGFVFGSIFANAGSTGAHAVTRSSIEEGSKIVAALVLLDPFGCQALLAGGGGSTGRVHVWEDVEGGPGIINADSDGSACGSSPNDNVIRLNGSGHEVKAGVIDDVGTVRRGAIFQCALQASCQPPPSNPNPAHAYKASDVPDATGSTYSGPGLVGGYPTPRFPQPADRTTRRPWEHRYDCRTNYAWANHIKIADCPLAGSRPPHISNLKTSVASAAADPAANGYAIPPVPCDLTASVTLTKTDLGSASGWWFNCAQLKIRSGVELRIEAGNVVVTGGASPNDGVRIDGTLAVNPLRDVPSDPDTPANTPDVHFVVRQGDFFKAGGNAGMILGTSEQDNGEDDEGGVLLLLENGEIDMNGGAGSAFDWFAPYEGDFEDLGLWSESPGDHKLGGDMSSLRVDGIYYMPNALFDFAGSGEMQQQRAQFISYRMWAHGNGALRMQPDPERAEPTFFPAVSLIR